MAKYEVLLPAMGEGIIEATINKWLVPEGSKVEEDDPVVEVATDKVDSEVPSPVSGVLSKIVVSEGSVAKVGDIIAIIDTEGEDDEKQDDSEVGKEVERVRETIDEHKESKHESEESAAGYKSRTPGGKFLSPLVRNIAAKEGISHEQLDSIAGTGMDGRITKKDLLNYISKREEESAVEREETAKESPPPSPDSSTKTPAGDTPGGDRIVEMDRVRRLIADHMTNSLKTSAHVTSYIDADVTALVRWRESVKDRFLKKEGVKLTLTPIFLDATAKALRDFPMLNASVDGTSIVMKGSINIGMATALEDGNLIVPVIKGADEKSLVGLAKAVGDLASRARSNKLKPNEITGGTFTLTNFGSYNNLAGTPIINQPQVAILGTGAVRKTPVVLEGPEGDMIGIRQVMILSLSYDHRIIDGALAGMFLKRIKEILETYSGDY